jgi:hypothetical protein
MYIYLQFIAKATIRPIDRNSKNDQSLLYVKEISNYFQEYN